MAVITAVKELLVEGIFNLPSPASTFSQKAAHDFLNWAEKKSSTSELELFTTSILTTLNQAFP